MHRSASLPVSLFALTCLALAACGGSANPSSASGSTDSGLAVTGSNGTYAISGAVSGAANVSVNLTGSATNSTSTNSTGNYSFAALGNGTYTITPSETGYVFSPASRAASVSSASLSTLDFSATPSNALTYGISGTVSGAVSTGVIITLNGVNVGSTATDLGGSYSFSGLVSGTYTVSASREGYSFTQALIVTLGTVDSASNNFTSMASPIGSNLMITLANPVTPATVGTPYAETVIHTITGGTAPYYYQSSAISSGTPPLGMIVNPNGDLTGTPKYAGQYDFAVCATDSIGNTTSQCGATSITVAAAPTPTSAPTVTLTANPTTITSGSSSTLTWSSSNANSCTANGGWTGIQGTAGAQKVSPTITTTYTLTCTGAGGTTPVSAQVALNAPATASSMSWVYYDGRFDWPGDYSFSATPNYKDTSGVPLSGQYDIKVTLTGPWGGWLPYAQNWDFNSKPYTKLTFALKPTVPNQKWQVYFAKVGDVPVGIYLDPTKYGPAPVVGQWATYTIPLADLGVLGTSIYKFCIQDQTGVPNNTWYVDNVGFVP